MSNSNWIPRSEFDWCAECGLNARIETKMTEIGERWLCLHCGASGRFGDGVVDPPQKYDDVLKKLPIG